MNQKIIFFLFLFISCTAVKKIQERSVETISRLLLKNQQHFLPKKISTFFILAGNLIWTGRGFVQPQDTVLSPWY
jgi:uncharacterized membrane protein